MKDSSNNSSYLNNSNSNNTSQKKNSHLSYLDISNIYNSKDHYLCTQCLKFPYVKFCKDRKHIKLTCSCFNNKKISIKDLFEENILSIEDNSNINLLSTNNLNLNDDIENELKCKKHNEKFKGFSKNYLNNYCQSCIKDFNYENYNIIKFDDIKIEDIKIEQLLNIINNNNKPFEESNINNTFKYIDKKNGIYEILSEEEEEKFNKIINTIINDYKNYPNYSHFFNIKNLLFFFNIEDKQIIEKEGKKLNNRIMENNESIIIEYNNNISNKTKLFSKTFVKKNKKSLRLK